MTDIIKTPDFGEDQTAPHVVVKRLDYDDATKYLELIQANRDDLEAESIYVPEEVEDIVHKIEFPVPEGRIDLVVKAGEDLVGEVDIIPHGSRAELIYWIDRNHRGLGYAKEAVRQAAALAFSNQNINELRAWVQRENILSQKTLTANGFVHEDTSSQGESLGFTLRRSDT